MRSNTRYPVRRSDFLRIAQKFGYADVTTIFAAQSGISAPRAVWNPAEGEQGTDGSTVPIFRVSKTGSNVIVQTGTGPLTLTASSTVARHIAKVVDTIWFSLALKVYHF